MARAVTTGMGPWNRAGQIRKRGLNPQGLLCDDVPDLRDLHALASLSWDSSDPESFWRSLLTWLQKAPLFLLLQRSEGAFPRDWVFGWSLMEQGKQGRVSRT